MMRTCMYVHLYVDVLWCLLQVPPNYHRPTRRRHAAPTPQCPVRPLCSSLYRRPLTHYRPTSPIADTVIMTSARRLLTRDIRTLMIRPLRPLRMCRRRVKGPLWVKAVPQPPPRHHTRVCIRACRTSSRKLIRPMTFRLQ